MIIVPTVFEKEWEKAEVRLNAIKETTTWVQIDVIDGEFSYGKTFDLEKLTRYAGGDKILFDIHLMVKEPINWIEKCIFVGASRIIGQVELMSDREAFVAKVKDAGLEAGLGFDIESRIGDIPNDTDEILLMSRQSGFTPKEFDNQVWDKIEYSRKFGKIIGVDGGIGIEQIESLKSKNVDIAYVGFNYLEIINGQNNN